MPLRYWNSLLFLLVACIASGQEPGPELQERDVMQFIKGIDSRLSKSVQRLEKMMKRIYPELEKMDHSVDSRIKSADTATVMNDMPVKQSVNEAVSMNLQPQYLPVADTITTLIKYLQQFKVNQGSAIGESLKQTQSRLAQFEKRFAEANALKKILVEKRELLVGKLKDVTRIKQLTALSKHAYYLDRQLADCKSYLADHRKAERKLIELLGGTKAFQKFMQKHSLLASLFPAPADDDLMALAVLSGLQTRAQVSNMIQGRIAGMTVNEVERMTSGIQQVRDLLNKWKNRAEEIGGANSDDVIPEGFKPNKQRTKSFAQRLELGANIQSRKRNGFLPTTSDIGLSVGYKFNDRSIAGIGISYKLGWGRDIRHPSLSHQGVGFRSFIDWKFKGSLWLSGGYETNYQAAFRRIDELRNTAPWQASGLAGLTKIVSLKSRMLSKTKIQLMWDFLSYRQRPATTPVILRVGYYFYKN